jgi:membrane-bound serine protease (ClpP class)
VELDVVDFVAENLDDLLEQANGRVVQAPDENGALVSVTLRTADAPIHENGTTLFEKLLYVIADPNVAFLLLSLGGLALVFEIIHPSGLTGIFGAIALVLAFFALGSLPTNWAGVVLIVFGFILIGVEILVPGFGAFGIGGIIALLLGGLILTGSGETGFQVSRWLVIGLTAVIAAFTLGFLGVLVKSRRMPSFTGRASLIGMKGITRGDLRPNGPVLVQGERWDATAEDPPLDEGTPIIVTASEGFRLKVKRDPASILLLPQASSPPPEEAATPAAQN